MKLPRSFTYITIPCIRLSSAIAIGAGLAVAASPTPASEHQKPNIAAETVPAEDEPAEDAERGVLTFQYENDMLTGTDRYYTNGVRLSYTSPTLRDRIPWAADALEWLYPFDAGADARLHVSLGQNMFTPGDIKIAELILNDRPYAGWLYAGIALNVEASQDFLASDSTRSMLLSWK